MSGLFGVVSNGNCMDDLFYGTDYQSHMGTEFAGLAVQDTQVQREIHRVSHGQFKNLLDGFYHRCSGTIGVGAISDLDPQPIHLESRFGRLTLVTAGLITNAEQLVREMIEAGVTFSEITNGRVNATELVAKMIAQGDDLVQGIEGMFARIEGSLSLLLMTEKGIYAACDPAGRIPLTVASRAGAMGVTTETCAFPNLGYTVCRNLRGGEIVFLDSAGCRDVRGPSAEGGLCAFLWIYTGYPASAYENVSAENVRERCGAALARKDSVTVDLVSGVPDSGTGHAIGYAMASRLPFRRPLVKYSAGYGRSYTPPSQDVRDRIAKMKLIPIESVVRGNRLVVCEDSIVRGTQLRNQTIQKLWDAGAAEVHVRVACPPLMFACRYNLSTRTLGELAARRAIRALEGKEVSDVAAYLDPTSEKYARMVEWIRRDLNCTSLIYLSLEEMVQAIGLPESGLCTYCWSGCACSAKCAGAACSSAEGGKRK